MKKIRVLEMIDRPFLGGGQITVLTLARYLDINRFEVLVASKGNGPLVDEAGKMGVRHVRVNIGKAKGIWRVGRLADTLRENKPDILHTHGGIAGLYGRLAARRAGIPAIVHTVHGIHYLHYRNPLARRASLILERRLSKFTDAVVFVSESDLRKGRELQIALPGRERLIRNGVDVSALKPDFDAAAKRAELGVSGNPLLVAVSRLHRQKGLGFLLRALPEVLKFCPGVKAVIVGGGPLESSLKAESKALGLGNHVVFLGERIDAKEILAAADIFVLPSLWEGLPYAVVEAAAAGKPIVASDIDGVREVLRNGETGILVPPGNPDKLAAAIVGLQEDPGRARVMAEHAQREIPPLYSIERMIRETEALYLELFRRQSDQINPFDSPV